MLLCFYAVPLSLAGLNACGRLFEPISAGQIFGETSFFDLDPCNTLKSHKTAKAFFGKAWRWNYRNLECLALAGKTLEAFVHTPGKAGSGKRAASSAPYHALRHTLASHPNAAFFAVTAGGLSSAGGAPARLSQPGRRRAIAISPSVK